MKPNAMKWGLAPLAFCALAQAADLTPPGMRLGTIATPNAYELRFAVDPAQPVFDGEARIELMVNRDTDILWMHAQDLEIGEVSFRQGEQPIRVKVHRAGQALVGFEALGDKFLIGSTTATIKWRAALEPDALRGLFRQREGGKWYVVSQFEALEARRAFPGFDEPGWKTPFEVTVDTPAANVVTSNTPELSSEPVEGRAGWMRHRFKRTRPLPTYLLAVAIGPYSIVDGGRTTASRTPLRYLAPAGAGPEARFAVDATPRIVDLEEKYFGIAFPYGKLDSVTVPGNARFGAMENAGMITYERNLMLARRSDESLAFQREYASAAAHEIAHQWFGDLVTLAWWNDVWLNEAFATWMSRKTLRDFRRELDSGWLRGKTRRRALIADRLTTARQIRNPVNENNDVHDAFDGITYRKGAEVLSMFESWMGEERFRTGVRAYLAKHADGNATSEDFFHAIGEAGGGERTVAALRGFVEQPGLPLVDVALSCTSGVATMRLSQHRLVMVGHQPTAQQWITPACFRYRSRGKTLTQCIELGGEATIPLEGGTCPEWLVGNANGAGYWIARYDAKLLASLESRIVDLPEAEAVALAGDTTLLVGSGLLARDAGFRIATALLRHPSMGGRHGAVYFLEQQQEAVLSAAQRQSRRTLLTSYVFPMARSFGWLDRAGDDLATQDLRALVMGFAARMEGGEPLRRDARELALRWLDDRASLPPASVAPVLDTAARFADAPTFQRFQDALVATAETHERMALIRAVSLAREPTLRERALSLASRDAGAGGLSANEALAFFETLLEDDANRGPGLQYLRAHWPEVSAKLPPDSAASLFTGLAHLCTRRDREELAGFFASRAAAMQGGPRKYSQALESIDACVASSSAGERAAAPPVKKKPARGRAKRR
jgi:Aminopeptidase N